MNVYGDMDLPSKEDEGFYNTIKKWAPEENSERVPVQKDRLLTQSYNTPTLDTRKKFAANPFQDSTDNLNIELKFKSGHESNHRGLNSTPSRSIVRFYNPESEDVEMRKVKDKSEYSELQVDQEADSENESNPDDTRELLDKIKNGVDQYSNNMKDVETSRHTDLVTTERQKSSKIPKINMDECSKKVANDGIYKKKYDFTSKYNSHNFDTTDRLVYNTINPADYYPYDNDSSSCRKNLNSTDLRSSKRK